MALKQPEPQLQLQRAEVPEALVTNEGLRPVGSVLLTHLQVGTQAAVRESLGPQRQAHVWNIEHSSSDAKVETA